MVFVSVLALSSACPFGLFSSSNFFLKVVDAPFFHSEKSSLGTSWLCLPLPPDIYSYPPIVFLSLSASFFLRWSKLVLFILLLEHFSPPASEYTGMFRVR